MALRTNLPCKQCPSSDGVAEYDTGFKCFSCGSYEWKGTNIILSDKDIPEDEAGTFPYDYTTDIPEEYRYWYRQYKIDDSIIRANRIGWSAFYKRIIIPTVEENWIGRAVYKWQTPKYIAPRNQAYHPFKVRTIDQEKLDGYKVIILVEDALSALKVSQSAGGAEVWSINGTGNKKLLNIIIDSKPNRVIIWLDGDQAGIRGSRKMWNELSSYTDCSIVTTPMDPKCYSCNEIKSILTINT